MDYKISFTFHWCTLTSDIQREKGRDLTRPLAKVPTPTEKSKKQLDNIKNATKTFITQRLRTNLGRSVKLTAVTPLVWLNRFTSAQPSY